MWLPCDYIAITWLQVTYYLWKYNVLIMHPFYFSLKGDFILFFLFEKLDNLQKQISANVITYQLYHILYMFIKDWITCLKFTFQWYNTHVNSIFRFT
jgi:hypothetical protein